MEHDKMFEYDSSLGWRFIPNKKGTIIYPDEAHHYMKTNNIGFRDSAIPNANDTINKILVLGDSFVSNISVKDEEVFTEVLEKNVNNTAVLNFGVNGYGQLQEYLVAKEWGPKIKPDLVILMIYVRNDFTDNFTDNNWGNTQLNYNRPSASWNENNQDLVIEEVSPIKEVVSETSGKIYHKLHLYHFVKTRINVIRAKFSKNKRIKPSFFTPPELYLCKSEFSENTKLMYLRMERILLKISNYIRETETPLLFVIAPSIVQVEDELWKSTVASISENKEEYIRSLPNDLLMSFAKENNLQMFDLLPILQLETRKGKKLYNPKEQHWTAEGNLIVAQSLLKYLRNTSLVK
ncbi:SGNH/GDSL hydrolase family protein [uncultured Aquimarina sp.]|uniref:SGNH/GDSL hydrolase family protein n=1 Tax=uncultured Aquimarina sp. TaxID=575652 RepID=UPI00261E29C2|nr:SGNH/GDSL hydrolase family protein [uncultured Aquimarina sp.]